MTTDNQASERRQVVWQIMRAALKAVDPAMAVRNYFAAQPQLADEIKTTPGSIYVVGAGKAGTPMAAAISEIFGEKVVAGSVIVKYGHIDQEAALGKIKITEAGHPVPDQAGMQGGADIAALLSQTGPDDAVICLISGGASALLVHPAENISLDDVQLTTQSLLAAGATINEFNTIRKHLSAVKGGGLARMAAPAKVYALMLSDVVGDPLEVIGSGPAVPDPTTFADTWAIIEKYQLQESLPNPVLQRLQNGLAGHLADTPKPQDPIFDLVSNAVIGSNYIAAQAAVEAAQQAGFNAQLLSTYVEGEAREVAQVMAALAKGLARNEGSLKRPACFVAGGETTVTIQGEGQGGRNQEMALAAAVRLEGWADVMVVCLGTDGTDGPTDAAGAIADGTTLSRARALGLEANVFLNRNDSYNFFAALDDLIKTGPTNTNVNDLTLIFAW